jgi:hypothetical protein
MTDVLGKLGNAMIATGRCRTLADPDRRPTVKVKFLNPITSKNPKIGKDGLPQKVLPLG